MKKAVSAWETAFAFKSGLLYDHQQDGQRHEHAGGDLGAEGKLGFKGLGLGPAEIAFAVAGESADTVFIRRLEQNGDNQNSAVMTSTMEIAVTIETKPPYKSAKRSYHSESQKARTFSNLFAITDPGSASGRPGRPCSIPCCVRYDASSAIRRREDLSVRPDPPDGDALHGRRCGGFPA